MTYRVVVLSDDNRSRHPRRSSFVGKWRPLAEEESGPIMACKRHPFITRASRQNQSVYNGRPLSKPIRWRPRAVFSAYPLIIPAPRLAFLKRPPSTRSAWSERSQWRHDMSSIRSAWSERPQWRHDVSSIRSVWSERSSDVTMCRRFAAREASAPSDVTMCRRFAACEASAPVT